MKRRIKRIAPLQAGKMLGALYACMGLILLPFFALAAAAGAFASSSQESAGTPPPALFAGMMVGFGIFMPIIYGVMGFVGGIIAAALYNLFAAWIGGIEVEVE
jgi:hypothetical protein